MNKETIELLEERLVQNLETLPDHGMGSEERKAAMEEICNLAEKLNESERINLDAWDKEERRRIEEEKNQNAVTLEQVKQNVTWKRAALQIGEKTIPIVVSGVIFGIIGSVVLVFEEKGRINSTIGRELLKHLPKW